MNADVYWSVEHCRWAPSRPAVDALATPWSVLATAQTAAAVPVQRRPQGAPVDT